MNIDQQKFQDLCADLAEDRNASDAKFARLEKKIDAIQRQIAQNDRTLVANQTVLAERFDGVYRLLRAIAKKIGVPNVSG